MGKTEEIKVLITADAGSLNRELTSAEKAVLKAKGIVQSASGSVEGSSKSWAKYRNVAITEMNKAMEGVKRAQAKVQEIRGKIQTTTMSDADVQPYIKAYQSMNRSPEQIQGMVEEMQRPTPALQQQYDAAAAELDKYKKAAQEAAQSVEYLNQKVEESSQAESSQVQAAKESAARAREQARTIRETAGAHKDSSNASKSSGAGLGRFARTAGFAMLGVASLYAGLRRLISAMLETARADSSMSSSLGMIKGNLQIAFQTVYQAALPALQALASALATVTGYLAQFMGMLFGVSWSSATAGAKDYAKGVGGAGSAAKKAAQNMMDLDELNVMQSDDSSGGGGGGGGITAIYKEMQKPQWLIDLVEWLQPIIAALERLWGSLKEFIVNIAEKLEKSEGWQKFKEGLTAIRDAIIAVIDWLTNLFDDKTFQALVTGVIEFALYTAGVALGIIAEGIQLIVALLNGDGSGALEHFLKILLKVEEWLRNTFAVLYHSIIAIFQGVAIFVNTMFADIFDAIGFDGLAEKLRGSIDKINQDVEKNGVQLEVDIAMNDSLIADKKAQIEEWFGGSKETTDAATESIKAYKEEVAGLKEVTDTAATASTDAITKALAETPTADAATQLGVDLMNGFAAGITENTAVVMTAFSDSIAGGSESTVAAAKQIATDAKTAVMEVVNSTTDAIELDFSVMLENIHFDLAYALGGVAIDIAAMVDDINTSLAAIKTQIDINVVYHYLNGGGTLRAPRGIDSMARGGIIHAAARGGGFSTGQLFVAREAGPELVAGIGGGRTAVMNNNQIVESVSAGVYNAVVDAMGSMQGSDSGDFVVNVDGRELIRVTRKAERASGYQLSSNPSFQR